MLDRFLLSVHIHMIMHMLSQMHKYELLIFKQADLIHYAKKVMTHKEVLPCSLLIMLERFRDTA